MKRIIRRQGKICYHDGFPLYVEQEGFIILVVHIRRKQESFTNTLSYFAPTAFSPRLNPIRHGEGNPVHHKGVDISRGPCDINLRIPKVPGGGGGVFKTRSCRGLAYLPRMLPSSPNLPGRNYSRRSYGSRLNGHESIGNRSKRSLSSGHGRSGQKLCKSHSTSLERHLSWRFV